MNLALKEAIVARFRGSTTMRATFPGGLWAKKAPAGTAYPLVDYRLIDEVPDYTMGSTQRGTTMESYRITFHIWSGSKSTTEIARIYGVWKRFWDDCHRDMPVAGYNLIRFERINAVEDEDEDGGQAIHVDYLAQL